MATKRQGAYARNYSKKETPQSEKIPGSKQVPNSAGGFAFAVDDWKRLERFLILGSEGGTYYATERKLTVENAEAVERCIALDPTRVVRTIVEVSDKGRAPKNDAAIFALALVAASKDKAARQLAYAALPSVCRIGTHLFQFVEGMESQRGWSRGMRSAVANWYSRMTNDRLAEQLAKYQQRNGWSHRDVLRLAHPSPSTPGQDNLFQWAVGKTPEGDVRESFISGLPMVIQGFEKALTMRDAKPKAAARVIRDYKLPRECVPTEWLVHPEVWEALLVDMPMTAMIRNLGNMSKCGLLKPLSEAAKTVASRLGNQERLKKARVHPLGVLMAARTYASGKGMRGSGVWEPVAQVIDGLDEAFYLAFENVEPTGKRFYLGLDISGSMWGSQIIPGFSAAEASGAMAMVTVKSESQCYAAGFTADLSQGRRSIFSGGGGNAMTPVALSPKQRLDNVVEVMGALSARMGGTDCALPMLDAMEKKLEVDAFIITTDSETWAGAIHPTQALDKYRQATGIPAKMVVCGMTSNGFSIANPEDAGQLDVVGFNAATPTVMANFIRDD